MPTWKQLVFNGEKINYAVSDHGEVMNLKKHKLLKQSFNSSGYKRVLLKLTKTYRRTFLVHRLVAWLFLDHTDIDPKYHQVNHIDGDKMNNDISNLEWCTPKENTDHAWNTGLIKPGEDANHHAYSNEIIHKVCKLLETGNYTHEEISKMTGVSVSMVSHIHNGANWTHISSQYNIKKNIVPDFSKYYEMIDDMIINGFKPKQIMKFLKIPDISDKQYHALIGNRRRSLKKYQHKL